MKIYQNPGSELLVGIIAPSLLLLVTIAQLLSIGLSSGLSLFFIITLVILSPFIVFSTKHIKSAASKLRNREIPLFETKSDSIIIFNPITTFKSEYNFDDIKVILFEGHPKQYGYIVIVLFSGDCFRYNLDEALLKPTQLSKALADAIPGFRMAYGWDYRVIHRVDDPPAKYFQKFLIGS